MLAGAECFTEIGPHFAIDGKTVRRSAADGEIVYSADDVIDTVPATPRRRRRVGGGVTTRSGSGRPQRRHVRSRSTVWDNARWNTWLIELVVTKPNRRSAVPCASAAQLRDPTNT